MGKAFRNCNRCSKKRWGYLQETPETNTTVKLDFNCSHCHTTTTTTEIIVLRKHQRTYTPPIKTVKRRQPFYNQAFAP